MKKTLVSLLTLLLGGCGGSTMYIQSDIPIVAQTVGMAAVKLHGATPYCQEAQYEERSVEVRGRNGASQMTIVHTCIK